MTTFLTWSLDNGKAGYGDIMITIDGKPDLPWPFDSLYYEPQTGMVCKVVNGRQVQLSEAEKEQCAACARRLVESADFYVSAIAEDGVYAGWMLKSQAEAEGKGWCVDMPDHPAARRIDGKWVRVVAVIMEDGTLRLNPDGVCQLCVVHMIEKEWEAFTPKPGGPHEKYDFTSGTWRDVRDMAAARLGYEADARRVFESVRENLLPKGVPALERGTWAVQKAESEAWLADATAATPFIDAALAGRAVDKAAFCRDVLANAAETDRVLARIHNAQWRFFDRLRACSRLAELDAAVNDLSIQDLSYAALCQD